jgi:nitrogen fixation/metabolism regulation signal transduction histidine kinase
MRRLTAPLADLSQQISAYAPSGPLMPVHIETSDEIGTLAETFNQMLFELSQQQLALNEQILFLQALIDVMPNPVFYKDADGKYLGV